MNGKKATKERLIDLIKPTVGKGYQIHSFIVDFADYGVPHTRKRLITIGKRTNQRFSYFTLHDKQPPVWFDVGREKDQITILQAITYLCKPKKNDLFRQIPTMNNDHAKWISNIPRYSGKSAFANNCSEKDCRHRERRQPFSAESVQNHFQGQV